MCFIFASTGLFANTNVNLVNEGSLHEINKLTKSDDCCTKSEGLRDYLSEIGVSWDKAVELSDRLYRECIQQ